jgi:hypothetical protein
MINDKVKEHYKIGGGLLNMHDALIWNQKSIRILFSF